CSLRATAAVGSSCRKPSLRTASSTSPGRSASSDWPMTASCRARSRVSRITPDTVLKRPADRLSGLRVADVAVVVAGARAVPGGAGLLPVDAVLGVGLDQAGRVGEPTFGVGVGPVRDAVVAHAPCELLQRRDVLGPAGPQPRRQPAQDRRAGRLGRARK